MSVECDAKLKQFDVLWAEIARRSNAQQTIIGATVTATGTIAGLVVSNKANPALFVVLAIVSPVFGLLWLDHALNISVIAEFISRNWRPGTPNWEAYYRTQKQTKAGRGRYLLFVASMTVLFLVPAIGGLAASFPHLDSHTGRIAGWIAAVLLTSIFGVAWIWQAWNGWHEPSQTAEEIDQTLEPTPLPR
jgi:MFS family permease